MQFFLNYDPQIMFFFVLFLFVLSSLAFLYLLFRYRKTKKIIKALENIRQTDLIETNKLLLNKSENDLSLILQIETVLEEIVKMLRRTNINDKDIIKKLDESKLLIEFLVKKKADE